MSAIAKRHHRSRVQWQGLIARAEDSELSVTEFRRRESVSTASFYTWRKRLRRREEAKPALAPRSAELIDLGTLGEPHESQERIGPWLIELDLGAGMVLRLRRC
jgi:transposase-like protein